MFSCLYCLDFFVDKDGFMWVGGCIKWVDFLVVIKYLVIFLWKSLIIDLLIKFCYVKVNYMGRGIILNELWYRGYWIVGGFLVMLNCIL